MKDMKKHWPTIGLLIIIAGLLFWNVENRETANAYKQEKEQADRKLANFQDSMRVVIKEYYEQDLAAIELIQDLTIKDQRHEAEIAKLKRDHAKIHFVNHSDSSRNRVLSDLYPSLKDR